MKLYAIFGNPVAHSISPSMHNYAFEKLGFDGCYTKILIERGEELRERFLSLGLEGVNITVPHKEHAFLQADEVLGIAKTIGAVNTWKRKDGKIYAYNTDAPGFYESVREFDFDSILIIGAGGTAKAIALYFKEQGYDPHILNRSAKRLHYFRQKGFHCFSWEEFEPSRYDLVINTTSAGLIEETLPAPKELLEPIMERAKYAVDVIYNKMTPFLQLARQKGLIYKDGTDMLLFQGVLAFEIFTDFAFERKDVVFYLRQGLEVV